MNKKQELFFGLICMIFVVVLVLSNISASNTFSIANIIYLSAAELLFPISYVVGDLLVEFYGGKIATRVIFIGLGLTLFSTVFLYLTTLLPSNYTEYNTVFGYLTSGVIGITFASIVAYAVGTLLNTFVMSKLKNKGSNKTKSFFKRAILSSIVAELADSLVFITMCCLFASQFYSWANLLSFVLTITTIKLLVELIFFPLTNYLRKFAYKKGFVKEVKIKNNVNKKLLEK